jgi:sugar phosphate isomerase/epimerase
MTDLGISMAALLTDPMAPTPEAVRGAVEAAAAAGFTDTSVWAWYLPLLSDEGTLEATRAHLDRRGMRVRAIEVASAWADGTPVEAEEEATKMAATAEATGASLVLTACLGPTLPNLDKARDRLTVLAERVGRAGASVAVEFLPWTGLPNLAAAWDLVAPLDAIGLVIDTWHWLRQPGGGDLDLLASVPSERILYLQLSDAPAAPSGELFVETMEQRLLPGDGVMDFAALLKCVAPARTAPFIAIEMFNPSFVAERGAPAAAAAMRTAAQRVLTGTAFAA